MKKKTIKSLELNKTSVSNLSSIKKIKGGVSLGCGEDTTTLWSEWGTCGCSNFCNHTDLCPSEGVACKTLPGD